MKRHRQNHQRNNSQWIDWNFNSSLIISLFHWAQQGNGEFFLFISACAHLGVPMSMPTATTIAIATIAGLFLLEGNHDFLAIRSGQWHK